MSRTNLQMPKDDGGDDGSQPDEEVFVLQTALFQAIVEGKRTVVDDLLSEYPLDLNLRNVASGTHSKWAIKTFSFFPFHSWFPFFLLRLLLFQYGELALQVACGQGDLTLVRSLLDHGAKLNLGDNVRVATFYFRVNWLQFLLIFFQHGESAMHWAARQGHGEIVRLLYERGSMVDTQNKVCFTFDSLSRWSVPSVPPPVLLRIVVVVVVIDRVPSINCRLWIIARPVANCNVAVSVSRTASSKFVQLERAKAENLNPIRLADVVPIVVDRNASRPVSGHSQQKEATRNQKSTHAVFRITIIVIIISVLLLFSTHFTLVSFLLLLLPWWFACLFCVVCHVVVSSATSSCFRLLCRHLQHRSAFICRAFSDSVRLLDTAHTSRMRSQARMSMIMIKMNIKISSAIDSALILLSFFQSDIFLNWFAFNRIVRHCFFTFVFI